MNHIFHGSHQAPCHKEDYCMVCEGGLADCTVCGGAEACLPSECPGYRMNGETMDAVQAGYIDYIDGEWHVY